MSVDAERAKSLFLAAAELPPAERAEYLDRECGSDADLRGRVQELLAADAPATVDRTCSPCGPEGEDFQTPPPPTESEGTVIAGRYKLLQRVGEGGMGTVWMAQQSEPVKRKVAVKLIKAGMDSRTVLIRFEAERQALALMDHPNIAKILDGGLHDNRPYFVMELVKGVPITEYCDAHRLTPRERLELFAPVCQAIHHAHQKGVIHRDIKPSNVLIALCDDKAVSKVIDFGVAKATGGALTQHTMDTGFGGCVGTPQYMSPEQATFNNLDIDTRSDVYSLGVLLYELLAGSPPFASDELKKRGLLEILRVVREEEPPRPSAKLSSADALPSLSASRGTEPKKLAGLLRNELDWIVMKALEKDRTRRYETANGFAADVQRYLAGEVVQAHPPSTAYRVKKFVRRNRPQVVAAGVVLAALLAGMVGTSLGLIEARRQTTFALAAQQAEADRAESERRAKFEAELVVERFCTRVANHPQMRTAELLDLRQELFQDAADHYKRTADLRADDPAARLRAIEAGRRLANILIGSGDYETSLTLLGQQQAELEQLLRTEPGNPVYTRALVRTLHEKAWRLGETRRPAEAVADARRALELVHGLDNPTRNDLIWAREEYGIALEAAGKSVEAEAEYAQVKILRTNAPRFRKPDPGVPLPAGVIGADDEAALAAAVGRPATVQGVVRVVRQSDARTASHLQFTDQARAGFSAVVHFSAVPSNLKAAYTGRIIRVTGTVTKYAGVPQIVVRDLKQVEVIGYQPGPALLAPIQLPETKPAPRPAGALDAFDTLAIRGRIGQTATVGGRVYRVGVSPSGGLHFINFDGVPRGGFTVIVREEQRVGLEAALGGPLDRMLAGRVVWVRGKLFDYKSTPEIELANIDQMIGWESPQK